MVEEFKQGQSQNKDRWRGGGSTMHLCSVHFCSMQESVVKFICFRPELVNTLIDLKQLFY